MYVITATVVVTVEVDKAVRARKEEAIEKIAASIANAEKTEEEGTGEAEKKLGDSKAQERPTKKSKSGTGKEKAKDPPSWALGNKPYVDENGKEFAKRLCDQHYGEGNYDTRGQSDYSKIRKWEDRGFE